MSRLNVFGRKERWLNEGLCGFCGGELGAGSTTTQCAKCAEATRKKNNERKRLQNERARRGVRGCGKCGREYADHFPACPVCYPDAGSPTGDTRREEAKKLWAKLGWCRNCGDPRRVPSANYCAVCLSRLRK
jgi:hypothetical protein